MNHVEALSDPHSLARGMVQEVEHPAAGRMQTLGVPVKLSRTGGAVRRPAPMLGEHTGEVIAEWLGAGYTNGPRRETEPRDSARNRARG